MRDPLAIEYPPALADTLQTFCDAVGLPTLAPHLHEFVLAFVLYEGLMLLGPFFGNTFVGNAYRALSRRTRLNFDIHIVSQVQCILILALAFPVFWDLDVQDDHLFSYSPYAGLVYAFAIGYFAWDSYISIKYIKWFGVGFAVHGIASFCVFLLSFKPFLMYYGPWFLMFEISTPFLNVHWFATHLPAGAVPEKVQVVNGVLLLVSFFFARIIWGFYSVGVLALDMYHNLGDAPLWMPLIVLSSNFSLDCLNVYWFSKMISALQRRMAATKAGKKDIPDLLNEEEDIKGHKME
ncbi:TLC domain-containing protein [Limtongia smithiae]|uniref:TLC domain-containing protein n=1 Tax=Limtongia smithiae TaxID=1125753 RepID=UPI0034D00413